MTNVLLFSAFQGLLLSLALISTIWKKRTSNFFLGLITLVISLELLAVWAVQTNYTAQPNRFPFWNFSSYLILPAAIFLLSKINTQAGFNLKRRHLFLFVPALAEILIKFYADYSNNYFATNYHLIQNRFWYVFTQILPLLALLAVLSVFWFDIFKLAAKVRKLKINSYHVRKFGMLNLLLSLIALLWVLEVLFLLPIFKFTLIFLCFLLYLTGYIAFYNPEFFTTPPFLLKSLANSPVSTEEEDDLNKIKHLFENEKIYLQPKVSVTEAASLLKMRPRRLSELINKYHQVDFRNYVNNYRIEEVIRKVEAGELKSKTLLSLALDAGFNSKSSFNQHFKDSKGESPTEFFSKKLG
jgi:AraC-like DNA-binding protein